MVKVTGAIQKSADIMHTVNALIRLPEISQAMQEMSMEMMKAGVIEEMMSDALEMEDDGIEDEAEEEVDRVIQEITMGQLQQAGAVGADLPKEREKQKAKDDEMEARLSALKAI
eukprot:jgi/Hompol1/4630/HPOL_003783-RA